MKKEGLKLDSRARILFIAPHLDGGGSERVLVNLINSIDTGMVDVELAVLKMEGSLLKELREGVKFIHIRARRPRYAIWELSRLIRGKHYTAVFVMKHYIFLIVLLAVTLSGKHIPLIYREVTHVTTELCKNSGRFSIWRLYNNHILYSLLYRKMSKIIAPSSDIKKDLYSSFNVPEERIIIINNPIDVDEIDRRCLEEADHQWYSENIPIIISAGRLVRQKNFELLIASFKELLEKGYKARLVILGKGEKRSELEELINKLGVSDKVLLIGHEDNPFKYISRSDIFVLPSLWEGFPNILLEAMTCGIPVISTNCPSGPSEIINNNVDGLLVDSDNAEQLCSAMEKLLGDESLRRRLGDEGRRKVLDKYSLEKIIPLYTDFLLKYKTAPGYGMNDPE